LVYLPDEEDECVHLQKILEKTLKQRDIKTQTISIKGTTFAYYEKNNKLKDLFASEREYGIENERLFRHLALRSKDEAVRRILTAYREIGNSGIIFLTNVAFAYPFLSLSSVMDELTNKIAPPTAMVIFYPGVYKNNSLHLLGRRESGYYRSRDII
jgi:hypothetical protein